MKEYTRSVGPLSHSVQFLLDQLVEYFPHETRWEFVKFVQQLRDVKDPYNSPIDTKTRRELKLLLDSLERPGEGKEKEPDLVASWRATQRKLEAVETAAKMAGVMGEAKQMPGDLLKEVPSQMALSLEPKSLSLRDNVPASFEGYFARRQMKNATFDTLAKYLDERHELFTDLEPLDTEKYPFFLSQDPLWGSCEVEKIEYFMFVHLFTIFSTGNFEQKNLHLKSGLRVNESLAPLVKAKGYNFRQTGTTLDSERVSLAIHVNPGDLLRYYVHEAGDRDVPDFHRFYAVEETISHAVGLLPIDREEYNRRLHHRRNKTA